jgi:eukaryotic-like serine/threonine-protein kinase
VARVNAEVGSAASSYEILAKLAMGGMAEIFLARGASAAGVERYVVLKRVLRHKANDEAFMSMFLDEARLAAQLQHANIAQVYDIGKLGDSYFFTMEYVHGETVRNLLQRSYGLRRPIPISAVLPIIAGAAAGLHHAHERKGYDGKHLGIVHRDVSPSNLMISYEGTVKVVDFGVAKAAHRDTETRSGTVKGKITYMSPEQCRGHDLDRRSDLFALGIVMWEMLTTERLFRRASDFENMQAIVSEEVAPPSKLRPDVPPEVDRIVMKLLAKSPADRYQTADELHEAIEAVAVATGTSLATASLGRFMRELFGQRPEPWIELQLQEAQPEQTVTNEPLASEITVTPPGADELDLQLSAVPLLSQRMTAQVAPAVRPKQHTVPLRIQADEMMMTLHMDHAAHHDASSNAPAHRPPTPLPAPTLVAIPPAMRASTNDGARSSVPPPLGAQYPAMNSSSSHGYPVLARGSAAASPPQTARTRGLLVLVPVCVVGTIVGIAIAIRSSSSDEEPKPSSMSDRATQMAQVQPPPAQPSPAQPPPPVAQPPAQPPPLSQPPVEAPPAPADGASSKQIVDESDKTELPANTTTTPPVKREPKSPPKDDVATLFKANQFDEVVSACSSSTKVVAQSSTTCTVAACKVKDTAKARRWFGNVTAAKRAAVVKACDGIALEPATAHPKVEPKIDPCKRDPLACQH